MATAAERKQALRDRGVRMPDADQVFIGPEVDPDRIDPHVVLHPGTRLLGADLSIGPDCVIGEETPATVEGCALGANVRLKGGFFSGSVFLDAATAGSSAHVRPGCLLEEEATIAHAVGLKQTILLSFVTCGSLINLCDCLVAGGTSRSHHSEIGSSFVHFNFTPHGDKATPSLFGDVERGVLLDQSPIFLGGQGGAVGPVHAEYGSVLAAGCIAREPLERPGELYRPTAVAGEPRPYMVGQVRDLDQRALRNLTYVGQLAALKMWYQVARAPVLRASRHGTACLKAVEVLLDRAVEERLKWLLRLGELPSSSEAQWPAMSLEAVSDLRVQWRNLDGQTRAELPEGSGTHWVEWVQGLDESTKSRIRKGLSTLAAGFTTCLQRTGTE